MIAPSGSIIQYLLIFMVMLTACGESSGPPQTTEVDDQAERSESTPAIKQDPITSIQQQYREITAALNSARLKVDSMQYECDNDPQGGQLNFYRDNGQLMMVSHDYYLGDHYSRSETYYLRNERPVFALIEDFTWQFGGPAGSSPEQPNTIDEVTEKRFYFTDYRAGEAQRAIRCLQKDYVIRSWIDIPTKPEEVPNNTIECGDEAARVLARFSELTDENFRGNCPG